MPRLSVVVPMFDVEAYLGECLDSIAGQTFGDLEVLLVDDGSTDGSVAIAEAYAARDPRFRVVRRPNGGLAAARNTGIEHATGELLAFVDSDDVLLPDAYERLVGSLDETGSDLATGKVLRLTRRGTTRATRFLIPVFRESRPRTHISRFRPLLADRIVCNKVFRRAFWDEHGLRFPEGRLHEDIPVVLPLHFSARAVDVVAEPVYLWRQRDTGGLSITERRVEQRALLDRLQAVTDVHDFLASHGLREAQRWYDASIVADDLKYYVNVLDRVDDDYRAVFLDRVNALLDRAGDVFGDLKAIERLKWHLIRRRLVPELLEVLRFQREELPLRPPVRVGRHWYGDFPFRGDPRLAIPDEVFRLDRELTVNARIDRMRLDGGRLQVDGWAYIRGIGAAAQDAQRVHLALVPPGRLGRLRALAAALRSPAAEVHRPDANARANERAVDVSWSGFSASLDPRALTARGRRPGERWHLHVLVVAGGVRRVFRRFSFDKLLPAGAVELPAPDHLLARAVPVEGREVAATAQARWIAVDAHRREGGSLVLSGRLHGCDLAKARLELREADGDRRRRYRVEAEGTTFSVRVPLDEVLALPRGHDEDDDEDDRDADADDADGAGEDDAEDEAVALPAWELLLRDGRGPLRVALRPEAGTPAERVRRPAGDRDVALVRTVHGDASLVVREPRALLTTARWTQDGTLAVEGERAPEGAAELVLFSRARIVQHAFALQALGGGRFTAAATPAAVPSLDGLLALPRGRWRLCLRRAGERDAEQLIDVALPHELLEQLPLRTQVGHKAFTLTATRNADAVVSVGRDLADDERGTFHSRRLHRTAYAARRSQPLREAVVFASFRGRQFSDSPRAIHEELVRRGAPLEHFWVVRDGQCAVPPTATVLREGSREHFETLATARYVVANDHFPAWFERRDDQVSVQTWHGTPLKRLGFDVPRRRGAPRAFERGWERQLRNWQYVVSPNRFSTPILERAYALRPEAVLETGYPRVDVLAGADREARTRALRARLGIPEGTRVVLYAPTYRDNVRDRRNRYRLDVRLDADRLRDALGPDAVVLFRKHHYVVDDVPETADGFLRDVSGFGDGTELLLAADVLVTDYSSMVVDFANTGRPMLFYTYDLDLYRDEVRGFYLDYEATVPGPLLRSSEELADALRDIGGVQAQFRERYDAFRRRFCELDDGHAAARVVDRVFGPAPV